MHHYSGAIKGVGWLLERAKHGSIPEEMLKNLNAVLELRMAQEPRSGFDSGHREVFYAWLELADKVKINMGRHKMATLVPQLRNKNNRERRKKNQLKIMAEARETSTDGDTFIIRRVMKCPRFPDDDAEYRFLYGALELLAKSGKFKSEDGKPDRDVATRFDRWAKKFSIFPKKAWEDIFPGKPEMHHYLGAIKRVGWLLERAKHGSIPEEMLKNLNAVLKLRMAQEPRSGFDSGHREVFYTWLELADNVKVNMGGHKMATLVPQLQKAKKKIKEEENREKEREKEENKEKKTANNIFY